ncbi:MAG: putative bifunctional diguanylate cyclase/phosphodiesterase [Gemmatimonadaceae bacterium]
MHEDRRTHTPNRSLLALLPSESIERVARIVAVALGKPALAVTDFNPAVDRGDGNRVAPDTLRVLLADTSSVVDEPVIVHDSTAERSPGSCRAPLPASAYAGLPIGNGNAPTGVLWVLDGVPRNWSEDEVQALKDLAAWVSTELHLRRHALHDALTGLPNRSLFLDRLAHAATRARRHKDFRFAVVVLDIDGFKAVNDSLGHGAGDELLIEVARRLETCVRSEDTVARLGGDDFALLLESLADETDAGRVTERIRAALATPAVLRADDGESAKIFPSASMGVVTSSLAAQAPTELLQCADIALCRAKRAGRSRFEMFDRAMQARALTRLKAETDLHHAVERGEFVVYYQPMVDLRSGRITELEALVRWQARQGIVPPLEFIPLAEETGLIIPIGSFVLTEACRQLQVWRQRFSRSTPLSMSVNLSVREFTQRSFVGHVEETIRASGIDPRLLRLEITESIAIEDKQRTLEMLAALRQLGVRIYLDDFGIGYSSLGYLHQWPLDAIKIDRTFVTRMHTEPTHLQLVRTVRALASNIGVAAVAEGVETEAQLTTLREIGCEYAQGYLFSKPVPSDEIERLLTADPGW